MIMFGKRRTATPPAPRQQIFPSERWDSDTGHVLRAVGMKPDDESNLLPTHESTDARVARDKAAHEARWAAASRDISERTGGAVQPFFLIPEPCWNGEIGTFLLVRLQLSPYEDWNVAFLPVDEHSAAILALPRHPLGEAMLFAKEAEEFVRAKMAQMDAIAAECDRTQDLGRLRERQDELKDVVRAFAGFLLEQYREVWKAAAARAG